MPETRVNPLRHDALTADNIQRGDKITYWTLGWDNPVKHATILETPYIDNDGDMVVDLLHPDGDETTELTSAIGLTGDRYDGRWSAIATRDRKEEG